MAKFDYDVTDNDLFYWLDLSRFEIVNSSLKLSLLKTLSVRENISKEKIKTVY